MRKGRVARHQGRGGAGPCVIVEIASHGCSPGQANKKGPRSGAFLLRWKCLALRDCYETNGQICVGVCLIPFAPVRDGEYGWQGFMPSGTRLAVVSASLSTPSGASYFRGLRRRSCGPSRSDRMLVASHRAIRAFAALGLVLSSSANACTSCTRFSHIGRQAVAAT
jgi:hypothetical protein